MSGSVLRASIAIGHLRLRCTRAACGTRSWALLPKDLDHPAADKALVSGFLDGAEALTPEALEDAARHLRVFIGQTEGAA